MKQKLLIALLILSAIAASLGLYRTLSSEKFLRGADGYYYALQANYFARTGTVKIPDSSVLHRITGQWQRWGLSTEAAVRAWQSASLFAFFLAMLGLSLCSRKDLSFPSALVLIYLSFSPSLLFFAIEFPKFFSMLLLVPFWFWPLASRGRWTWLAWALASTTCLFHRGALPLAGVFSLALIFLYLKRRIRLGKKTWAFLALAALAVSALFYLLHDRFRFLDLQRITWKNPQIGLWTLLLRPNLPNAVKIELIAAPLLAIFAACRHWKIHPKYRWDLLPAFSLWLPAFFPFGGGEVFGVGERYAILLPAFSLVACLYFFSLDTPKPWAPWKIALILPLAALPAMTTPWRLETAHPRGIDPDFSVEAQVSEELGRETIPMLIANKGLVFYYKFQWMREAFPYEPERHWDKTKVWRLTDGITPDELFYYTPEECRWDSGLTKALNTPGYSLMREDCYEKFRDKVTETADPDLYQRVWRSWRNPSMHRPSFLYPKHVEDTDEEFPALPPKKGKSISTGKLQSQDRSIK